MTDSPHPEPEPLAFTSVPGRTRHDGWTLDRQRRFIQALAAIGTVTAAARSVGMSAKSAYALLRRAGPDSSFAHAWDAALDRSYYAAVEVALKHGLEGERIPVFYGGRQVGQYRRYDTRLALAALQAAAVRDDRRTRRGDATDPADRLHSALHRLGSSAFPGKSRDL